MKKSVVILIALIYVASIAVVGFLGLKAKSYNDVIYVESLEILTDYEVDKNTGNKYIRFFASQMGSNSLQIECRVKPDNVSDDKIIYKLDPDCTVATVDDDGLLTFTPEDPTVVSAKVYIYSNQDPTIADEIIVYFIP